MYVYTSKERWFYKNRIIFILCISNIELFLFASDVMEEIEAEFKPKEFIIFKLTSFLQSDALI